MAWSLEKKLQHPFKQVKFSLNKNWPLTCTMVSSESFFFWLVEFFLKLKKGDKNQDNKCIYFHFVTYLKLYKCVNIYLY